MSKKISYKYSIAYVDDTWISDPVEFPNPVNKGDQIVLGYTKSNVVNDESRLVEKLYKVEYIVHIPSAEHSRLRIREINENKDEGSNSRTEFLKKSLEEMLRKD